MFNIILFAKTALLLPGKYSLIFTGEYLASWGIFSNISWFALVSYPMRNELSYYLYNICIYMSVASAVAIEVV